MISHCDGKIENEHGDAVVMDGRSICIETKEGEFYRVFILPGMVEIMTSNIGSLLTAESLDDVAVRLTVTSRFDRTRKQG